MFLWKSGILRIVVLLVLVDLERVKGQSDPRESVRCDAKYCVDKQIECTEIPECKTIGFRTFLNPENCNCCDYCFEYLEEGRECRTASSALPNVMCGPLLECKPNGDIHTCQTMSWLGTCSEVLDGYHKREQDGTTGIADWRPHCNARGQYSARQCLAASSVCICMTDDGKDLWGMSSSGEIGDCACSRHVQRLESFGIFESGPHCLPNGDYDPLQCSLRQRTCHCHMKPDEVVSMSQMKTLPCYNETLYDHNEQYVRQCELARGELDTLIYESESEGISDILIGDLPRCSPDGNYAAVQSRKSSWICTDSNGNQIENFGKTKVSSTKPPLEPPTEMTCLCARMRHFMGDTSGKPKCCPSGNFRTWQCTASKCYCVDARGIQDMTKKEVPKDDAEQLECYTDPNDPTKDCPF